MNYTVTGDGQIDFAAEQLQLTFDMPGPMPGNMEMVVDGDAAYLNMPSGSSAGDDETRWVNTEVDEAATDQMMQSGMSQDPTDVLTALGAVEAEITVLGNEEVGGEPTHGYAFDVSADEVSRLGGEQAEKVPYETPASGGTKALAARPPPWGVATSTPPRARSRRRRRPARRSSRRWPRN